jgi:hypothetical protein
VDFENLSLVRGNYSVNLLERSDEGNAIYFLDLKKETKKMNPFSRDAISCMSL